MSRRALAVAFALLPCWLGCTRTQHPNVAWIVIDTLRADALHVAGYPQSVSPAIDTLAAAGVRFDHHHANATQTVPSTLTMLLSQSPAEHGFSPVDLAVFTEQRPVYPPSFVFFAEVLRDAGYATAGFTSNPYLGRANGFDQGFDAFETSAGRGEELVHGASAWLDAWAATRSRPFHVYLHLMDVHQPYSPPDEYLARWVTGAAGVRMEGNRAVPFATPRDLAYNAARYAACVAYVDHLIGRFLGKLDELGLRDDTIVVLTSDHGEEFGEHGGIGHGRHLYGEVVRVPLIVRWPGRLAAGRVVAHASQHLDLAPALLALGGVDRPPSMRGASVFEPIESALLEIGPWRGVVAGDWKLVRKGPAGAAELFALADRLDRARRDEPAIELHLGAQIDAYEAARPRSEHPAATGGAEWSEAEKERLRALGYAE